MENEWLERYVQGFVAIVEMFHPDIQIFESFNEPDDWHGEESNWVHPGWFAILLQRIHTAVRSRPALNRIKLVSGPLQGLETNRNAAVHYLQNTYSAGKLWFGWGRGGVPFPFDGVGYHLYVKPVYTPDETLQARAIRAACGEYLSAMHQLIRQEEGKGKALYVSEVGSTRPDRIPARSSAVRSSRPTACRPDWRRSTRIRWLDWCSGSVPKISRSPEGSGSMDCTGLGIRPSRLGNQPSMLSKHSASGRLTRNRPNTRISRSSTLFTMQPSTWDCQGAGA